MQTHCISFLDAKMFNKELLFMMKTEKYSKKRTQNIKVNENMRGI